MPVRLVNPLVAVSPDDENDHPVVDVIVPVHNEAHVLAERITTLHVALASGFPYSWRITIVDNASTDGTWWAARHLAADLPRIRVLHLDEKGRGRALRAASARTALKPHWASRTRVPSATWSSRL